MVLGRVVEHGTFLGKKTGFNLDVVTKGVCNEIGRVYVLRIEIHTMHFIPRRSVNNTGDLGPDAGYGTHPAWLKRAVESAVPQVRSVQSFTGEADRYDFRVGGRVVAQLHLIMTLGDYRAVFDDHAANLTSSRLFVALVCLFDSKPHEAFVVFGIGHIHQQNCAASLVPH
jgi:hypothetical protein